jgi:nitrous oxide reductase accessory protein NosL
VYFDGPKDMFRYLLDLDTFKPGSTPEQVAAVFVTDYYSTRPIDGRTASYVVGSDVMGPMGAELVPTADRSQAETLLKDHGGERVAGFGEVTAELVKP